MSASNIVSGAQSYASGWVNRADSLMAAFNSLANAGLNWSAIPDGYVDLKESPYTYLSIAAEPPSAFVPKEVTLDSPKDFVPPTFSTINTIPLPNVNISVPTINLPVAPTVVLPDAPTVDAHFNMPVIPQAPVLDTPVLDTLNNVVIPNAPVIDLPTFAAIAPTVVDLDPPSNTFAFAEEKYESAMLDALKAKLLDDLQNGGYGIEPADEAALWDRAREREATNTAQAIEEIDSAFAARGFMQAPGALFSALEGVITKAQQAANSLSRDIALKRADLYVQNRQFTIQQVKDVEQVLLGFHAGQMERLLNAEKYLVDFAIAAYNAKVASFNAKLEAYKTEGQVFESKLRAAVEVVNVYRSQVDAARVQSEVNRSIVDTYRARMEAVSAAVNLYRVQMEAAQIHAGIERTRLDALKAAVDAYVATVQGKTAEFGLYRAQIEGELAKVQAFDVQVKAKTLQIDAAKAQSAIASANTTREVEVANAKIATHRLLLDDAKTKADFVLTNNKINLTAYESSVTLFKVKSDIGIEKARSSIQLQNSNVDMYKANATVAVERARVELEGQKTALGTRLGAADAGARIYAQMISGALSAVNALAVATE